MSSKSCVRACMTYVKLDDILLAEQLKTCKPGCKQSNKWERLLIWYKINNNQNEQKSQANAVLVMIDPDGMIWHCSSLKDVDIPNCFYQLS